MTMQSAGGYMCRCHNVMANKKALKGVDPFSIKKDCIEQRLKHGTKQGTHFGKTLLCLSTPDTHTPLLKSPYWKKYISNILKDY